MGAGLACAATAACVIARLVAMEVEQKQADLVQQFVLLAGSARGRAAVELITHATSHPQLFAFSELLSSPHIAEVGLHFHSFIPALILMYVRKAGMATVVFSHGWIICGDVGSLGFGRNFLNSDFFLLNLSFAW